MLTLQPCGFLEKPSPVKDVMGKAAKEVRSVGVMHLRLNKKGLQFAGD